jgi:hypothetical protein
MMYSNKYFLIFFIIYSIAIGTTFLFENSSNLTTFRVLAMDNPIFTSSLIPVFSQDQLKSDEFDNKSLKLVQELGEKNTCPPKPTSLERNLQTSKSIEDGGDQGTPISIKVPTIANTGSSLLIEGTGYIPLEQVRIELSVDWLSTSPEFKDKSFFQCKMIETNNSGSFATTLKLPETPFPTKGMGKYSIIGMESRQEKTAFGSFLTSKMGFSFRQ